MKDKSKLTNLMKNVLSDISKYLLKEGDSIIVVDDYRVLIETLSLMAKQISLCKSCMLLLDSNAVQESYLLARSQFNNLLWIKYLLGDCNGGRLNEFIAQPLISQKFKDKQLLELLPQLDTSFVSILTSIHGGNIEELMKNRMTECDRKVSKLGVSSQRNKSILQLAKEEPELYSMYVTMYMEGSKFEHSDISTTSRYRKEILPEYNNTTIFKFVVSDEDGNLWEKVFMYAYMCVFYSYEAIKDRLLVHERHLLQDTAYTKAAYDEEKLKAIDLKFLMIQNCL